MKNTILTIALALALILSFAGCKDFWHPEGSENNNSSGSNSGNNNGSNNGGSGTSLSAPTGVSASAVSSSSITINWNSVSGAGWYNIYRSSSSSGTYSYVGNTVTSVTSYTDYGLSASATYYYKVSAKNNNGESSYSSYASATTKSDGGGTSSGAPTGVTAAATSSSSITISWNPSDAGWYNVYRSSSASGTYTYIGNASSASYTDNGLSANTTYYYKVTAYTDSGESSQSSYASATTSSGSSSSSSYTVNMSGGGVKNSVAFTAAYQGFSISLDLPYNFDMSNYTKYTIRAKFYKSNGTEIPSDYGLGQVTFLFYIPYDSSDIYADSLNCMGFEYNLNVQTIDRNFSNPNTQLIPWYDAAPSAIGVINSRADVAYIEITEIKFHN